MCERKTEEGKAFLFHLPPLPRKLLHMWTLQVDGFLDVGGEGCSVYTRTEPTYVDMLRNKQRMEVSKRLVELLISF